MKLRDILNEEKYTVIDPRGNSVGMGLKLQAASFAKKKGGEKAGYFVVPAKNALKARRALEKFKGDFKNPKLKDIMSDLYWESVNEAAANPATKKFLKGMQSIKVNTLGGYMPGVRNVYWDKKNKKFWFVDFEGDHAEILNIYTLKQLDAHIKKSNITLESVNEADNDEKYVVIAFHEKGGGFVMTRPGSKKDAEDSARSITKSSDITQQKAVKVSDARKIRGLVGKEYLNESVNEARKLKIGKEDFSYLLKLSDKELVKKLNSIRKDQQTNGKQYMDAFRKKEDTSEIEKEGQRLATLEKAVIAARDMINFESVNEGYSTEEKRIIMMAVRKLAKYRNVPLEYAITDLLGAGQELERDIKNGKIK